MSFLVPVAMAGARPLGPGYGRAPWLAIFLVGLFVLFVLFLVFLAIAVAGRRRMWHGGHPMAGPPSGGPQAMALPPVPVGAAMTGLGSAEAELARRFALGEIDEPEYEQRLGTLRRLSAG